MKIGVYIHIPFCTAKCSYCDFASFSAGESIQRQYVAALKNEISQVCKSRIWEEFLVRTQVDGRAFGQYNSVVEGELPQVDTVFIGGGTPSVLYRGGLSEIISELKKYLHLSADRFEFTVEANPESVSTEFVKECVNVGANRMSLGLQTAADHLLKNLRRHTFRDFQNAVNIIREAGIDNINADIMLSLPGQRKADVVDTLNCLIDMNIPHISVYSLKVEEGTLLHKAGYCPDDDASAELYEAASDMLVGNQSNCVIHGDLSMHKNSDGTPVTQKAKRKNDTTSGGVADQNHFVSIGEVQADKTQKKSGAGYVRYEVSNFSKPGFECKHNQKYWQMQPYLGFGLSASSYTVEKRATNTRDLEAYLGGDLKRFTEDARENFLCEYIMLGLRTTQGVRAGVLEQCGLNISAHNGFRKHFRTGALMLNGDIITLNPEKYYIMNSIISDLI